MQQLVGQHCVHCSQRFFWEIDCRFCAGCGLPVHDECARKANLSAEGACPDCGAPRQAVQTEAERQQVEEQVARSDADATGFIMVNLGGLLLLGGLVLVFLTAVRISIAGAAIVVGAVLMANGVMLIRAARHVERARVTTRSRARSGESDVPAA